MIVAAMIGVLANAGVAQVRLPAGTVIEAVHVAGCDAPCALVGRQLSRTVFAGRAFSVADTQEPDVVERNERVALILHRGSMRLEAKGRSLGAGPIGGQVDVMNDESRRVVTGIVVATGVVEVAL